MGYECDELPSEVIFEILSRTTLETLERCKEVSKSWKQIIYEPTFLPLHSQRTNSLFGYFFQDDRCFNKYPWAFVSASASASAAATTTAMKGAWPSDNMMILASCNQGILCCVRQKSYNKRYYAGKPATGQWQALPNPKLRYHTDAVAIVVVQSQPLRYIIARLHTSPGGQFKCEIFDSEIWAWEKIECATPYGDILSPRDTAVTTAGQFLHWLTYNDNVLTLDVKKRCFRCSPLPETVRCNPTYKRKQLVEYEGGLGLICLVKEGDRSEMELWTAAGRKMAVDMTAVRKDLYDPRPVDFCSSGVVFMRTGDGGVFYNLQNSSFSRVVEVHYELTNPWKVFRLQSDFEIVDLKGGRHTSELNRPTTN